MLLVLGVGISILGVVLVAALRIQTSPGQYEDALRTTEAVLACLFAGCMVPIALMLLWKGSDGPNRFGDEPMVTAR